MESIATNEKDKHSAHHRSPSYPVFALGTAIEKAKLVYENDKRSATDADVIASHLGYSAAKGPGGRAVSALKQYGLLEENSGKYRISDLGFTLVHYERDSTEWRAAVADAAMRPTLFRELSEQHPDGLPSDAALKNDLLKRGFNPAAISEVISITRDTMSLALGQNGVYNEAVESTAQAHPKGLSPLPTTPSVPSQARSTLHRQSSDSISTPVGKEEDGRPVFASVSFDAPLRKEFVTGLKKYLEYLETTLQ